MANMQALINAETKAIKPYDPPIKPVKIKIGSISFNIIVYLINHGLKSGGDLIIACGLKNSPMAYIKRHIETNMIICEKIDMHQCNYSINPNLGFLDFGLTEENLKWKQNY